MSSKPNYVQKCVIIWDMKMCIREENIAKKKCAVHKHDYELRKYTNRQINRGNPANGNFQMPHI